MILANIYLNFKGTTEEAFEFYRSAFGGEFSVLERFKDVPDAPPLPEDARNRIMHVALPIGASTLMGSDALESMGHHLEVGNNVYVSLHPDSLGEAQRLFAALSVGGKVEQDLQPMFWGAHYGAFADRFGVQWMINYAPPKAP